MTHLFHKGDEVYIHARGEMLRGTIVDEGTDYNRHFVGVFIEAHGEFFPGLVHWYDDWKLELVPGTVLLAEALEEPSK